MEGEFEFRQQLSDEERHAIEALRQIADEVDNDPRINRIIRDVATGSLAGLQFNVFTQLIKEFVALVVDSTKVSAQMVEKIVRIFILMWRGPELSNTVLQEMYPGTSVDNTDTVDGIYIPQEVSLMDDEFIEKYKQVLKFGKQKVRSIRLMVVGMFGIGKTSLVENLVDRDDNSVRKPAQSTEGIDVTHCNIRDGKWILKIFDNNTSDKFLEVMQNPAPSDSYVDEFDTDNERLRNEDKTMLDEDDKKEEIVYEISEEILYERTSGLKDTEEKHMFIETPSFQEPDADKEELKRKLTKAKEDDPELHAFATDLLKSTEMPHNPLDSTISIWDFAGQYIYYSTHHFFLNSRSIYLLLMDISIGLHDLLKETSDFPLSGFIPKDFTCLEAFKFWLNSIHMYSTQVETDIKPSVILVGTKKDKLKGTDEEKERQKEDYFNEALKSLNDSPATMHVHRKKFLINNLDKDEDFSRIREEVVKLAKEQRYWGELRPAKWISLERTFLGLKSEDKEIITFDEMKTVDREKSEIPIKDEEELRFFLKFQHQLGNVLYYETDMLKDFIILSPQWIIDAFRCFISHVKDKHPRQLKDWDAYEKKAILTKELIDEIIDNTDEKKYFRDYKDQVIEYMEHLDMIAKPVDAAILYGSEETKPLEKYGPENSLYEMKVMFEQKEECLVKMKRKIEQPALNDSVDQDLKKSISVHFYIVPSLLKLRPEYEELSELTNPDCIKKTPILCFYFINNFMPPSVFHRLLAVCIREWSIVSKNKRSLLFNGFAVFKVSGTVYLSIWFQDNIIYARVSFYSKVDYTIPQKIRTFLSDHLMEILRILPKESRISEVLPFEEYIQCSCVIPFEANTALFRMRYFFANDEDMCEHSQHVAKKDEVIGLWCYASIQNQQKTKIPDIELQKTPTAKKLARVSRTVGSKYKQLWKELGLKRAEVDQIEDDNRFHLPTRIYQMLCKWKKLDGTVQQLRNAMVSVDSDINSFDDVFVNDQFQAAFIDLKKLEGIDLNRKPTDVEIAKIAGGIGHEYKLLGVELGIQDVRLEQLNEENHNLATRVLNMLKEWCKVDGIEEWRESDCNIKYLGKAMFLVGSDMKNFYKVFSKDGRTQK